MLLKTPEVYEKPQFTQEKKNYFAQSVDHKSILAYGDEARTSLMEELARLYADGYCLLILI